MSTNAKKDQLVAALVHYDSQLCVQHLPVTVGRTPSEKEYWEVLNKEVLIERCQMLGLRIDVGQGKIKKKEDFMNVLVKYHIHDKEEQVKKKIKLRSN
jgi:hypothetical protein